MTERNRFGQDIGNPNINENRLVERDYSIGGGVTMRRQDFEHGFGANKTTINQKESSMKHLKDIMTKDVACLLPDSSLIDVAKKMVECNCGEIPIVESFENKRVVGVVTDRDIVCRTIAVEKNPLECFAKDCMTGTVVMGELDMSLENGLDLMEENKIRRLPIVDSQGRLCGIISQADLVNRVRKSKAGEMIQNVSKPTDSPSAIQ
jgi:CBS domain-containing protein